MILKSLRHHGLAVNLLAAALVAGGAASAFAQDAAPKAATEEVPVAAEGGTSPQPAASTGGRRGVRVDNVPSNANFVVIEKETAAPTPASGGPIQPVPVDVPAAPGQLIEIPGTPGPTRESLVGEFRLSSDPDLPMLRLTAERNPQSADIDSVEGAEFVTDVHLSNRKQVPIDRLHLVIDYNPAFVEPVAVNDAAIADRLAGTPRMAVSKLRGLMEYSATLKDPLAELPGEVLFIRWKALKPVVYTPIVFGQTAEGTFTELFSRGKPVLGTPSVEGDGTLSAGVMIVPADPAEALMMQEDPQLYLGSNDRVGGVQLALIPPSEPPRVGEPFYIDVVLDNSVHSRMDAVSLMIEYDKDVLELIDVDRDNWITLGMNILDGPFHDQFPFDYHMANQFYPGRGRLEYRVGASFPDKLVGARGVMARIVAVPKRPAAVTEVTFMFATLPGRRTTTVSYLGQDVLGQLDRPKDGVRSARFRVLPAKATPDRPLADARP